MNNKSISYSRLPSLAKAVISKGKLINTLISLLIHGNAEIVKIKQNSGTFWALRIEEKTQKKWKLLINLGIVQQVVMDYFRENNDGISQCQACLKSNLKCFKGPHAYPLFHNFDVYSPPIISMSNI